MDISSIRSLVSWLIWELGVAISSTGRRDSIPFLWFRIYVVDGKFIGWARYIYEEIDDLKVR